jgi:hypothetical protein
MARRVAGFLKDQIDTPRRYPWPEWTDGKVWEIRQGDDYDVATENMRVNLHERAKLQGTSVRTEKVAIASGEGLRFQFKRLELESPRDRMLKPINHRGMNPWSPQTQRTQAM